MTKADGVEVRWSAIRAAARKSGSGDLWLELRTTWAGHAELEDVLDGLNERFGDDGPFSSGSESTPRGELILVQDVTGEAVLEEWCAILVARVEAAGASGTLGVPPRVRAPECLDSRFPPEPTAFITWTFPFSPTKPNQLPGSWRVSREDTAEACAAVADWTSQGGTQVLLKRGWFATNPQPSPDVASHLAAGVLKTSVVRLVCWEDAGAGGRSASFAPGGHGLLAVVGGFQPWQERIDALRDAMVRTSHLTTLAFVRRATRESGTWPDLANVDGVPDVERGELARATHLLGQYVPDANGMQVLTDAHLEKAHDLTSWVITDLGHGRHLVEAKELAAWYAQPDPDPSGDLEVFDSFLREFVDPERHVAIIEAGKGFDPPFGRRRPDPAVVARARQDFGDMVLTSEVMQRQWAE